MVTVTNSDIQRCWWIDRGDCWEITHHPTRAEAEAAHADRVREDHGWVLSVAGAFALKPGVAVQEPILCRQVTCPDCGCVTHFPVGVTSCVDECAACDEPLGTYVVADLINPGPVDDIRQDNAHRVGAPNHLRGSGEKAMVAPENRIPSFALAADVVLFSRDLDGVLHVLLIERGWDPYAGCWALPGGYVEPAETFEQAARRELVEETGLVAPARLVLAGVYDAPMRDPRGRVISVAYTGYAPRLVVPRAGDDAAAAQWVSVDDLGAGRLAFDHADILRDALKAVA